MISILENEEKRESMMRVIVSHSPIRNGRVADERALSAVMAVSNLVSGARHVEDRDRDSTISIIEVCRECRVAAHSQARCDSRVRAVILQRSVSSDGLSRNGHDCIGAEGMAGDRDTGEIHPAVKWE
jgi:hypothetical protein